MNKKAEAEQAIMKLSSQVTHFEEMFELDELIMSYMEDMDWQF